MNELALFAGAGGGILGGHLLGWNTVCAVEIEEYPRNILLQRQRDGILPPFPIWDDVCTFDGSPWRGIVDIISGGFPCQDISAAGKGAGISGSRSGLWKQMHRIICEVRPRFAFVENSPMLVRRGLGTVLADLAEAGYHAAWCVLGADDVGAPHVRKRIWILARDISDSNGNRGDAHPLFPALLDKTLPQAPQFQLVGTSSVQNPLPDTDMQRPGWRQPCPRSSEKSSTSRCSRNAWWASEPGVGRVAHGVAHKMDRLKAIGNGQVPLVAATAFLKLNHILNQTLNIKH